MDVRLTPAPLRGTLSAIPSKSEAHRLLICAALADRPTELWLPGTSADLSATERCLWALGAGTVRRGEFIVVSPISDLPEAPFLDCGESGSTLRFLLPVAAALADRVRLTGRGRLPQRPIGALREAMKDRGTVFSRETLPLETRGRLHGGAFSLPGDVSSQYITGLLLAMPLLAEDSVLTLRTHLESAGYVEITLRALRRFGVEIERDGSRYRVRGGQSFRSPGQLRTEGDWSNAAFFLAAGALGAPVGVAGLDAASPQGDQAAAALLERFGAGVERSDVVSVSPAPLRGCEIDLADIPDLLPVLAVLAACAEGETRFVNGGRLRLKESDRLKTTAALLTALGGDVWELPDGLIVRGRPRLAGGTVDGANDHRIVMAAAVAAIRCAQPVTIRGAEAVEKSYPAFFADYQKLGGNVHVL